ncbi:FMN-binding negative transcriptional regulator [Flavihumibacter fluvii]|uniref:FMN-binding negative transcriptional regulator n=1 Tax=Flavihumibacter fluvii TaxID=2838157 RepID=UPI001BDDCCBE|nr:FMN-binding negative transcriptional regulator [Flavihumibacter fluvii]ULQ52954.1 FMN-binding negative transcriptional regulator [Flavihumibacter fluvii]
MYDTKYFKAADDAEVVAFMQAHPFVVICGAGKDGIPVATHVPVLLEERDGRVFLLGHFMRKQEHTLVFQENPNALVIFSGAHAYISASWYADPKKVSTWNYQAVHATGTLKFADEQGLFDMLVKLTRHFEGRDDSPSLVSKMDEDYLRQNMKAIIGFEVEVTRLSHVFKLSQNRQQTDFQRVIDHLKLGDAESQAVAGKMEEKGGQLFGRE